MNVNRNGLYTPMAYKDQDMALVRNISDRGLHAMISVGFARNRPMGAGLSWSEGQ